MLTKSEAIKIILVGLCNSFLGPTIFIWGIYPELLNYMEKREANNVTDEELALKYHPLLWAYLSMLFCSFVSGVCADLAVTIFSNNSNWRIKLGKVATFLAKALFFQTLAFIFYNVDPLEWRTPDGLLGSWGPIELPIPTCCYCVLVQLYFSRICTYYLVEEG
ncbi:uncharacterized protein LOC110850084 [Folsomia candida]|uniref:uncharacterized protein LOC110850084 n=1 Tax=Folsomia candida TaxID=158441 RepID=UPI000B904586|nr:uncharacterized protein LOC110850084 [Folsomia candida]